MTGATPHATTATRGIAVTIPLRGAAASRAGRHTLCHVLQKNLALFQLTPDRCDPTSLGAPMPATMGPSHGRQSLSQLLAVRSNARNGANALQWAIPLAICERKGTGGFRPAGFQGLSGANSTWRSGQNPRKSLVLPDLRGERPPERRRRWPGRSGGDSADASRIAAPRSRTASTVSR